MLVFCLCAKLAERFALAQHPFLQLNPFPTFLRSCLNSALFLATFTNVIVYVFWFCVWVYL